MSNPYPPFNPQDGYGQSPYAQYQPPPSTAMATWALVLAVLSFIPLAWLTSLGLAIAVLVRSGNGRDFGRKRAIVALVIDVLWLAGFALLVVLVVLGKIDLDDTKRDAEGHVTEANVTAVNSLKVGDCFDQDAALAADEDSSVPVVEVTVKPCSELHHFEEYAEFTLPDGDYPGEDAINAEANDRCYATVREYVGPGAVRKLRPVSIYFYYPMKLDWTIRHDRIVQCMFAYEGEPHIGSLKKG